MPKHRKNLRVSSRSQPDVALPRTSGRTGILIAVFVKGLSPDRNLNDLPSPFLDKTAPRFDLPKLRDLNERVASTDYDGQVAIVNFWATWCVGCRQEHAFLMELSGQNVVPIYGVDWRDRRDRSRGC